MNGFNNNFKRILYIILGILIVYFFFTLLPVILAVGLISWGAYKLVKIFKKQTLKSNNKTDDNKVIDVDYEEV